MANPTLNLLYKLLSLAQVICMLLNHEARRDLYQFWRTNLVLVICGQVVACVLTPAEQLDLKHFLIFDLVDLLLELNLLVVTDQT